MNINELYSKVDHTNLSKTAEPKDIVVLCNEANAAGAASVCVPPYYVKFAAQILKDSPVKVCTVIGFPNGYSTTHVKATETMQAIESGASEIDMVINIAALKSGDVKYVENEIEKLSTICHQHNAILKVIVETCLLTEQEIKTMCDVCICAKADFIKTSTGFDKSGATVEAVSIMKERIGEAPLNIKASGGIRTIEDAEKMVNAGASRIGASSLIPKL